MHRFFDLRLLCAVPLLWLSAAYPSVKLETHASGVFLNGRGDILTAHHAVKGCRRLYLVKDGRVEEGRLLGASAALDLAVLRSDLRPWLAATLARTPVASGHLMVYAESYADLQRLPAGSATLFNAMAEISEDNLSLLSPVRPGASGSLVMDASGLMLGMVVERVQMGARPNRPQMLSRGVDVRKQDGATRVRAVPLGQIKAFLHEQGIPFAESDEPQLGPQQIQGKRAATLSVGVICG